MAEAPTQKTMPITLCVALAAMARSMKEGQYYLSPLYVVALPLVFVTLVPGIKLDLFTSLVPITGVARLLRTLLQEDYAEARRPPRRAGA